MTSTAGLIAGCSGGPIEGNLPKSQPGTPEDMEKIQQDLLQKKVASGTAPKKPPGVNIPSR